MLNARRAALAAAVGALAVLAVAVGPPPTGPETAAAQRPTAPSGGNHYWAQGDATATWEYRHTNNWSKVTVCNGFNCPLTEGTITETHSEHCERRAASPGQFSEEGCGHSKPGWTYTGHGTVAKDGTLKYQCADSSLRDNRADCGSWVACGDGKRPNSAGDGCEDVPAPPPPEETPAPTTEAAQTTQPPTTQPPTTTAPPGQRCGTWVDGECIQWLTDAPVVANTCNRNARRTSPPQKVWHYRTAFSTDSYRRPNTAGVLEVTYPRNAPASDTPSSTPFHIPGGGLRGRPWSPLMQPGFLSVEPGGDVTVPARRQYDFKGVDLPDTWYRETRWEDDLERPGNLRWEYVNTTEIVAWTQQSNTRSPTAPPRSGCVKVTIRSTGAGWVLQNVTLADDEAATSGSGRGELTFEGVRVTDPDQPARLSAWEGWDVIVELQPGVGAPWPACTPAEIAALATGDSNAAQATRNRQRFYAWSRPQTGWRPTGAASARSCAWSPRTWSATLIRVTDCPDAQPGDDGKIRCLRVGS